MTNCPNCGAPIVANQCEYCETVFDISDYAEMEELKSEINLVKAKIQHLRDTNTIRYLYEDAIRAIRDYGRG